MNSSLVAQAMEQIRQRRLLEDIALEQRLDEITLKVPEVMEARNQLAQTSAKLGRLIFTRGTDIETGVAKIRDENLALQEKERVLLRQNGYPEDYLRPQGRFKHMFAKGNEWMIEEVQKEVDRKWEELQKLCNL